MYERIRAPKHPRIYNIKNLTRGQFNGEISDKTAKRLKDMVINLHTTINAKTLKSCIYKNTQAKPLSFITLTLSEKQKHDDNWIKRHMLDRFLVALQRKGKLRNYIWKSEAQKNGNIHFHIITSDYIEKNTIRSTWNAIQNDCGYLDGYKYIHKHGNAPSTEIKACRNVRHTAYYVAKYISKKGGSRPIKGRLWGCSDKIRLLKTPTIVADMYIQSMLRNAVDSGKLVLKELEHCNIYTGDVYKFMADKSPKLAEYYVNEVLRNWNRFNDISEKRFVVTESSSTFVRPQTKGQIKLWEN